MRTVLLLVSFCSVTAVHTEETGSVTGHVKLTRVRGTPLPSNVYASRAVDRRDAPSLPDVTNVETFAISPDTRKILTDMGHNLGVPQPANHLAAIIVGAPSLGGKPVGNNRFYGANDPRRNTGLALGY